jgi:hypothetical protein
LILPEGIAHVHTFKKQKGKSATTTPLKPTPAHGYSFFYQENYLGGKFVKRKVNQSKKKQKCFIQEKGKQSTSFARRTEFLRRAPETWLNLTFYSTGTRLPADCLPLFDTIS